MSHTPEQARALWCPMVRIARREIATEAAIIEKPTRVMHIPERAEIVGGCNSDALGGNRVPTSCLCIADQCAMWRWEPSGDFKPEVLPRPTGPFGTETRMVKTLTQQPPTHGHCGIAGRPEVMA